jgi:two-component system chemotaxis response regulator CheB
MLRSIITSRADMKIASSCSTADETVHGLQQSMPDVILLSQSMAEAADMGLLERLLKIQYTPVVILSDQPLQTPRITMKAMELGVIGYVSKPKADSDLSEYGEALCDIIRTASSSVLKAAPLHAVTTQKSMVEPLPALSRKLVSSGKVLVIGASTGGTEAIKEVLMRLPEDCPGIVITQHMPEGFTESFAVRLNSLCQLQVKEASNGERILPGHAYLAPGHSHLLIKRQGTQFICELSQNPPVNRHRPSVDVLFQSAARHVKGNAIGIILTGMGRDGAEGMRAMHDAGAHTFAQDEATCVVFGMPKEAIAYGGVDEVVALPLMAERVMAYLRTH